MFDFLSKEFTITLPSWLAAIILVIWLALVLMFFLFCVGLISKLTVNAYLERRRHPVVYDPQRQYDHIVAEGPALSGQQLAVNTPPPVKAAGGPPPSPSFRRR